MKNKKIIIILAIFLFVCALFIVVNKNTHSFKLETDYESGEYIESELQEFPTRKYTLNTELSKCKNGSTIEYDEFTNAILITGDSEDKCEAYYNALPVPDVFVSLNEYRMGGSLARINCSNGTASYTNRNQLEITSVSGKENTCSLDYYHNTNEEELLVDKVISLARTTAGRTDWKVVHEVFSQEEETTEDYVFSVDNFKNVSQYTSTSAYSTAGTSTELYTYDNGKMVSSNFTIEEGKTYNHFHYSFNVETAGYHEVCVYIPKTENSVTAYLFKNNSMTYYNYDNSFVYSSKTEDIKVCKDLGKLTATDNIRIVFYESGDVSPVSFSVRRINSAEVEHDTGYRFEGTNPNNYVWFNDELWRIIGVMNSEAHGIENTNLTKIIRINPIGSYTWNNINNYEWQTKDGKKASINMILNNGYLKSEDDTGKDYCWSIYDAVCDFRRTGIKKNYRDMIKEVYWMHGNSEIENTYITHSYNMERKPQTGSLASSNGKVGLMYYSDFGYSALSTNCGRNGGACTNKNWLAYSSEWYINKYPERLGAHLLDKPNEVKKAIRPTVYLDENVLIISGRGTPTDPFILGM